MGLTRRIGLATCPTSPRGLPGGIGGCWPTQTLAFGCGRRTGWWGSVGTACSRSIATFARLVTGRLNDGAVTSTATPCPTSPSRLRACSPAGCSSRRSTGPSLARLASTRRGLPTAQGAAGQVSPVAHGGIAASTAQIVLEGMGWGRGGRGLGTGRPLVVLDDGVLAGQGPLGGRGAWGSTREVVQLWGGLFGGGSGGSRRGSQQVELSREVAGRWRRVWGAGTVWRGLGRAETSGPQDTTPRQALEAQRGWHCGCLRGLQVQHVMRRQEPISWGAEWGVLKAEG